MKFNDNDFINLDYSDIKDEVSENIRKSTENKTKIKSYRGVNLKKALSYALCVMLTCVVSVGSTLLIQGSMKGGDGMGSNGFPGNVDPGKSPEFIEKEFDELLAFGSWWLENGITFTENVKFDLLGTDIISESDKDAIREFEKANGKSGKNVYYYNIYMGMKDGKDTVVLSRLIAPYQTFKFESNLQYSFSSVLEKFEELSGEELTREFLLDSTFDNDYYYSVGGISVRFVLDALNYNHQKGKSYIAYYIAIIDGQVYIVTSKQLHS